MNHDVWLKAHAAGALLLGLALVHGTWAWHRVRRLEAQAHGAAASADTLARQRMALLRRLRSVYLLLAVPGSLLLLGSGTVMIHTGAGWAWALQQPWLLAMLGVTLLEFSEGITITRQHLDTALAGRPARDDLAPHLDLPLFLAVVWLGLAQPRAWSGVALALAVALAAAGLMAWAARRGRF
ncbi:MAG: hypothetical protein ACOVOG_19920 [Rubrivivax sp.]|jgi:hypothetical protein|nr:hypothetical protein [Rubrivivax sp.]